MSDQIPTHFVEQYTSNIDFLLQQKGSRLRNAVMNTSHVGKSAVVVDQYGPVAAQLITTRHADTPLIDTPTDRRWVHPKDYKWADLVDSIDKLRMIHDPTSPYAINGAYALGRSMDNEIISAFFGTAKTGENGSTNTAFDTSNQQIAVGGTGLTVAKLREAKKILMGNDVDVDNDLLFLALTATQHDNMLSETQAISLDYNIVPTLVAGKITAFMGFNFIHTELLTVDSSSDRRCPCWAKSGMNLGLWNDIGASIDPRHDKNNSMQVLVEGTFGATRLEEGKVVEVICDE